MAVLRERLYSIPESSGRPRDKRPAGGGEASHPAVLGRFEIGERLGAGSFGVVYRARDTQLHRVALAQWMAEQNGPAAPLVAAKIVLALAEAVRHAHERHILHRDIKPQNVLLDSTGSYRDRHFSPKLTDFGVAKILNSQANPTATGVVVGTLRYMSPEQRSRGGDRLGVGCDIYALGVVLYELLTGQALFADSDFAASVKRVISDEPRPPRKLVPGLPRDLEAICLRRLDKNPARRYASAALLVDDLERFLAGRPTVARPLSRFERVLRWARRRPGQAAAAAIGLTALVLMLGGLALYSSQLRNFNERLNGANVVLGRTNARLQTLLYVSDMRLSGRAYREGDQRELDRLLRRHIPKRGQPDRRGFEWRFLWSVSQLDHQTFAEKERRSIS
jgi:hypothetical protein